MSYDFATAKICTHEVFFEKLSIKLDGMTASISRPPSSKKAEVYIDGEKIPSSGLYSYAEISTSVSGPFDILSNINDVFQIGTDKDNITTVKIPTGRITSDDLVNYLKNKIPSSIDIKSINNKITFSSKTRSNKTQFVFPDPVWNDNTKSLLSTKRILGCYSELGITPGRYVYGTLLYPGWTIRVDPASIDGSDRVVVFNEPITSNNPLVQINYISTPKLCRRCNGSYIEFDYTIKNNTYETVRNTDLLMQEFDKFLHTDAGSHWKWPWLGSALQSKIGGKGNSAKVSMTSLLNVDISQAFKTYQDIKRLQDTNFPQQKITDSEYPLSINDINIRFSIDDPTIALIDVVITSRSREKVQLQREVGASNPLRMISGGTSNFVLR